MNRDDATTRQDVTLDYAADPADRSSGWEHVGVVLVLLLVPLMLLALFLPPTKGQWGIAKIDWALEGAIVVAALALLAWWTRSALFPRPRSTLPLIVLVTALLLIANVIWVKAYREYNANHTYHTEVFRRAMQTSLHAPAYGRYDNALARWNEEQRRFEFRTLPFALLSIGIAAAWYLWARRRPLNSPWDVRSLLIVISLQLALIVAFALCEPWPTRFSLKISGYSEFKLDLPAFTGVADTFRNYVARMPKLEWYGQHYPPGNLILLMIERQLGATGLTKTLVCLCTILSAIPLWGLARELDFDPVATSATLLLYTASTGVLIYCTLNTTSLLLLPGTVCLWTLIRALRGGSLASAAVLGLAFALYLFFSFSASILGLLMALTTLIGWRGGAFSTRNVIRTAVAALATLALIIVLLSATTHFDLLACFLSAVRGHHTQQGNEGFDDAKRYLLRSSGNILAYLLSAVPLCVLAAAAVVRAIRSPASPVHSSQPLAGRALFLALAATIFIAGFSGLFYVETERIWIFLTPPLALAAGHDLARRTNREGQRLIYRVFLLVLVISCAAEFFVMHYR